MNEGKPAKANWWSRSSGESAPGQEASDPAGAESRPDTGAEIGGDFELERPRATPGQAEGDAGDATRNGGGNDGDFELPLPVGVPDPALAVEADSPPVQDADPADPHSTPPYGHPGPWAPAPPVQHPAAAQVTPAHGTAVAEPLTPAEDPWRRYDPWAARTASPLQQNGAGPAGGRPGARKRGLVTGALVLALLSGGVGGIKRNEKKEKIKENTLSKFKYNKKIKKNTKAMKTS